MSVISFARDRGTPLVLTSLSNRFFSVAALASQKMKTSAALACAASSDQRDRMSGATTEEYRSKSSPKSLYLRSNLLVKSP